MVPIGWWVLVVSRPWFDGEPDRRTLGLRVDREPFGFGIAVQPIDPISRDLIPGALILIPWDQVLQATAIEGTQDDLRRLVGNLDAPRAR